MPILLLVDGHSQAYRAYFGLKTPLATHTGEPTTAVYGFARKLLSVLKEFKPDYVAVAFDLGDTWRHSEFPDYKATRERMPDDMRSQMGRIDEFLRAFNIPVITYPNFEADDVLGALARQAAGQGFDVLIMSGDRDMFQLVGDHTRILYTSGGPNPETKVIGLEEVNARYGLTPQQFVEFKALIGDSSDNIPGVAGVGEKTAIKLLQQFGSIDALYARIGEVSGAKLQQALRDSHDQVMHNRRLVTIVTELDNLTFSADSCRLRNYNQADVVSLFTQLEFRSLIKELPDADASPAIPALPVADEANGQMALFAFENDEATATSSGVVAIAPAVVGKYLCIQDTNALQQLVETLSAAKQVSFDVETTSTDAMQAKLVGLGIGWGPGQAAYIPLAHQAGDQLPWPFVRSALQPIFADSSVEKLAHNGKYDLTVLLQHGMDVAGPIHDTMVLAWLLDPASRSLGLKAQAGLELDWQMTELNSIIGVGKKQITVDYAPIDTVAAYCGADVDATWQLFAKLLPRVNAAGLEILYRTIELPLLPVLTAMERTGILLDTSYLKEMSQRLGQRLQELELDLHRLAGREFNLRSTQQMSQVLFDDLKFPTRGIAKTASGHYSTAVSELEKLYALKAQLSTDQARVLDLIFEQRQLEKLRGTYVDALPALVNPNTGRLHTSFNQAGAVTGRMSSSDPNLQNIPIRTELGREIRRAFVAPAGSLLISADYSQVELRILAHVAEEESLIEAFNNDQDIHVATASRLFHIPTDQVTKEQRGLAKTINFATIYGSSAFGISSRTDMDPGQARQFLSQYFAMYPRIEQYISDTKLKANQDGYVQTLLGRKRFFPELQNPSLPVNQRMALERQAINAPIQGTAADIMKIAMLRLAEALQAQGLQARMLLQVHDELVIELPAHEREIVADLVRSVMSSAYHLSVPLKADVEVGPNWYDLESI